MQLIADRLSRTVGAETYLHALDLELKPGAVNVILGATLAGKTSLLRLLAGLDRPSGGKLFWDGQDVTGVPPGKRDLAMVYQTFINYPSLTVFENIAAPLRNAGRPDAEVRARVGQMAETLHLTPFLDRRPAELSGGQQQRTALARALVKGAGLLLLDEPLVNLDYKLREELRAELAALFAAGGTTVVYATTEPLEALQLGGQTVLLHEGRLLQAGPAQQVFERPASLAAARTFSDPPLNVLPATWRPSEGGSGLAEIRGADLGLVLPAAARAQLNAAPGREFFLAIRPHQLRLARKLADDQTIDTQVDLAEITGSETFLHLHRGSLALVLQAPGVHPLHIGHRCTVYVDPGELYGFDAEGQRLFAPGS
jgi:glycerol transport system ATP-binding protein